MPTASEVPVVKGEPVPMESLHVSNEVQSVSSSTPAASDTSRSLMDAWSSQELHDVFNGDGDEMIVVHNTFIEWCKMAEVNQYNILHQNGGSIHPDRFTSAPAIFGTSSFLPAASPLREVPSTVPEVASPPTQPLPSPPVSATTVMVRNIPTRISSKTFIEVVLSYAPAATLVDFLYLPIDFKTNKNLGYCFINFVSEDKAAEFTAKYNDRKYVFCETSEKKLQINMSNRQGFVKNLEVFTQTKLLDTWPAPFRPLALWKSGDLEPIDSVLLAEILASSAPPAATAAPDVS